MNIGLKNYALSQSVRTVSCFVIKFYFRLHSQLSLALNFWKSMCD